MEDSREAVALKGGLDEVGMGALAGPLVAAVAVFKADHQPINGVKDSKKLTKKRRVELASVIMEEVFYIGVGWASPKMIDDIGVAGAWQFAVKTALANMPPHTDLIVDGIRTPKFFPPNWKGTMRVESKADDKYWEVSAASIAAKVIRDLDMLEMAKRFPAYGWGKNAGYPTSAHYAQLRLGGPTPYHRRTFLKNMVDKGELPASTCVGVC